MEFSHGRGSPVEQQQPRNLTGVAHELSLEVWWSGEYSCIEVRKSGVCGPENIKFRTPHPFSAVLNILRTARTGCADLNTAVFARPPHL